MVASHQLFPSKNSGEFFERIAAWRQALVGLSKDPTGPGRGCFGVRAEPCNFCAC